MRYLFIFFLLSAALQTHAEELTLRQAISDGLTRGYSIQIQKSTADAKKDLTDVSDSRFDPSVTVSVTAKGNEDPTDYTPYNMDYLRERSYTGKASLKKLHYSGMTGEFVFKTERLRSNNPYYSLDPSYRNVFLMNITQPLLKNFGRDINTTDVKNAELTAMQYRFDLYSGMLDTAAAIEKAYYSLSRARDILALALRSETLAQSLLEYDKKRYAAGIIPVTEVQQAETALAGRQERVVSAKEAVKNAADRLSNLTNTPVSGEYTSTENIVFHAEKTDCPASYETALKLSPNIEKQRIELKKYDLTIKYMDNQQLPELDLVGTLGASGLSGTENSATKFEGGYSDSLFDMTRADGVQWLLGVNFSYPLGARGAKSKTASLKNEKLAAVYTLKKTENDTKTDIRTAINSIESAEKRYDIANTFISLAETTLDQEMKKMNEGLSDTFRILKFQDDLIDAQIRSVNALYDHSAGLAVLRRAEGTSLDYFGFKLGE
ncbi:MAG: TolC family protein [Deferribacterales bacterium]